MSLSAAKRWGSHCGAAAPFPVAFQPRPLSAVQMAHQVLEIHGPGQGEGGALCCSVSRAARMSAQVLLWKRVSCCQLGQLALEAYSSPSNLTAQMVWHPEPPNELPVLFNLLVTVILFFFFFLPFWIHWTHVGFVQRKYGESHPNPCHSRDAESQTQSREHQLGIVLRKCFYFCKVIPAVWPAPNSIPG